MSQPLVDLAELKEDRLLEDWRERMLNPMSGLSRHTRRNYELGVSRFVTMALPDPETRNLAELLKLLQNPSSLRKAVEALSNRYAKSTVVVTLAAVNHLALFMEERKLLAKEPKWPKVRIAEPEFDPPHYSDDEAAALVAAASHRLHLPDHLPQLGTASSDGRDRPLSGHPLLEVAGRDDSLDGDGVPHHSPPVPAHSALRHAKGLASA